LAIPDRGIKPKPENSQNHHEAMVEPSKHDDENRRQMRLFFTQAFATSTVIQGTSTLSTWKSCWSTPGAINDCSSTSLVSGKRRRRESEQIEDKPYVLVDGKQYDFAELIKASRVSRHHDGEHSEKEEQSPVPGIFEGSISDFPQCMQKRLLEDEPEYSVEPRLITVTSTITTSIYSTVTSTAAATQTLVFTSVNNAQTGCIPRGLLSSLSIPQC